MKHITVHEAFEALGNDEHCLLDVRTGEEVEDLGIPGARSIPLGELPMRLSELESFSSIHVICRSGGRSAMATELLHRAGLNHAMNVSGGIIAWSGAGLPTK